MKSIPSEFYRKIMQIRLWIYEIHWKEIKSIWTNEKKLWLISTIFGMVGIKIYITDSLIMCSVNIFKKIDSIPVFLHGGMGIV